MFKAKVLYTQNAQKMQPYLPFNSYLLSSKPRRENAVIV